MYGLIWGRGTLSGWGSKKLMVVGERGGAFYKDWEAGLIWGRGALSGWGSTRLMIMRERGGVFCKD